MFSVLELRSQVALWEQYFRDSSSEIENLQGELIWYQVNNPSKDAAIKVEHFQNQLLLQQKLINEMFRQLKLSDRLLKKKDPREKLEESYAASMKVLGEKLDTFQKLYNEMKAEFKEVIQVPMYD
jgi:hypothetical protein